MMRIYLQYQKPIVYSLAAVAFVIGCVMPDNFYAKSSCFGFAGGVFFVAILNSVHMQKKVSAVEGSPSSTGRSKGNEA